MKKLEQGKALSYLAEQEKDTLFTLCEESEESFSLCGLHVTPVTYTEEQIREMRKAEKEAERAARQAAKTARHRSLHYIDEDDYDELPDAPASDSVKKGNTGTGLTGSDIPEIKD